MELDNSNVLFTSGLLGLDKSCGVVDASDKAASNLWIEGTTMPGLFNLQDSLDPSDDLVGTWVRWLVQIDHTILLQNVNWSVQWRVTTWEWGKMIGFHVKLIVILQ